MSNTILVVDDLSLSRVILRARLSAACYQVRLACSGIEALEIARAELPDLVLMDCEMPGLDGYELAFTIRDTPALSKTYIILHTSLNSEMSLSYANQVGANEALTKFDASELVHAMLRGVKE